jgi:hypothetical protein
VVSRRGYPTGHGRPGNYIVHALLDRTGALGAREALALYGSAQLISAWDPDTSQELPQLVVRAEPGGRQADRPGTQARLGELLRQPPDEDQERG